MHTPMASAAGKDVSPVRGVPLSASSPPLQPHPRSDSISRSGHQLGTINQGQTSASNVSSPALPPPGNKSTIQQLPRLLVCMTL